MEPLRARLERGPARSVARLEQWVETVRESKESKGLSVLDEMDLTHDEIRALETRLGQLVVEKHRALEAKHGAVIRLSELRSKRDELAAQVAAAEVELSSTTSEVQVIARDLSEETRALAGDRAAAAEMPVQVEDLHVRAARAVDLERVAELRRVMLKHIGVPRAAARATFEGAANELRTVRAALHAVGLDSEELRRSIVANHSRPARDAGDLRAELRFVPAEAEAA